MAFNDFPPGLKFAPSDCELIYDFLTKKIRGDPIDVNIIEEANVYAIEPQQLHWPLVSYLKNHERYYFVKRERLATKNGTSKRAKRTLESDAGFWRLSTGERKIKDDIGSVVGLSSSLNFWTFKDPIKKDRTQAIKSTRWLMTEYKLSGNEFQEWVICKIKDTYRENPTLHVDNNPQIEVYAHHKVQEQLHNDQVYVRPLDQVPQQEPINPETMLPVNQIPSDRRSNSVSLQSSLSSTSSPISQSSHQIIKEQEVLQNQYQPNYNVRQEDQNIIEIEEDSSDNFFLQTMDLDNSSWHDFFQLEEINNYEKKIVDQKHITQEDMDLFTSLPKVVEYSESETSLLEDWANL